jgi:hypothetical protein
MVWALSTNPFAIDGKVLYEPPMRVGDLVQMPQLGLRVLAGEAHLDREIRWVHVTDLPDPERYLRGGELILTNGLWRATGTDAELFVAALARCHIAALGQAVYETDGTPADLIDACRRHDVVLLEVPDRPFMDISEAVINQIIRDRSAMATHLARVEQSAVWRLGRGEGPQGILRALHHAQGIACWVADRTARVVAAVGQAPAPKEVEAVWHAAMSSPSSGGRAELSTGRTVLRIRATPGRPDQVDGILAYGDGHPDAVAQADLDLAGDLLGQELAHRAAVRQAERQYAGELLALAAQDALSAVETAARLRGLHLDPQHDLVVVAATPSDGSRHRSDARADGVEAMLRLGGLSSVIVAVSGESVYGVAALPAGVDETIVDRTALVTLTKLAGPDVAVGVAHGQVGHLRRVVTEASHAAAIAAMAPESPSLSRSQETGSHLLLLALHSDDVRGAFITSVLGPIHSYDTERSAHLVESLIAFLESGCSWQRAAARLHVHVNTVRYRIRRVEQLTGRDLDSMNDRVDLHLAIQAANLTA